MFKRDFDYILVFCALALSLIGIAFIYSATCHSSNPAQHPYYLRQAIWLGLSLLAAFGMYHIPIKLHEAMAYVYYGIAVFLLILVLAITDSNAERWFYLGGIAIQPVEIAKIALCITLARLFAYRRAKLTRYSTIFIAILIVAVPTLLVIKQPDLGSSLVGMAILLGLLIWTGMPLSRIALIISPVISIICGFHWLSWAIFFVAFIYLLFKSRTRLLPGAVFTFINLVVGIATPILWNHLHEYQRLRILIFLDPGQDPAGAGYQIIQSKIAIGSGGFLGKGFMQSTQTRLDYLPAQHTDFIFSVIGEEAGFIGASVIIILFAIMIVRGYMIAYKVRNTFTSYVAAGLTTAIFFQMVINIGMTIGLMPVTGLPLPFVSYGGSSLMFFWGIVGLLLAIKRDWQEY